MEREQIRRAIDYVIESNFLFFIALIGSVFGIDFLNQLHKNGIHTEMEKLLDRGDGLGPTQLIFRDFLGRLVVIGKFSYTPTEAMEGREDVINYATERIKNSFPNWLDKVVRTGFPRGTSELQFLNEFVIQLIFILLYVILANWDETKAFLRRINDAHLNRGGTKFSDPKNTPEPEFIKEFLRTYKEKISL